jgi:uncharacterized membrane protein YfcA
MLAHLVLPMSIGSLLGAIAEGYLAAWSPTVLLRVVLAVILGVSAIKLLSNRSDH